MLSDVVEVDVKSIGVTLGAVHTIVIITKCYTANYDFNFHNKKRHIQSLDNCGVCKTVFYSEVSGKHKWINIFIHATTKHSTSYEFATSSSILLRLVQTYLFHQ